MKEICVIGGGRSGISFIERIKEKSPQCKIKLIDKGVCYFDKKDFLSTFSVKKCFDFKKWAQDKGIEFISGVVERINPKRKKIYFKENDSLDFDALVVATGLTSKKLLMKGEHRDGFFYLSQVEPFRVKDLLKISQEVTVYAFTIVGIKLAIALGNIGKEVKVVADNWDFLGEDKGKVVSFLENKGITVYLGYSIEEAIGEGIVKAAKLAPLKILSSQLVFVDSAYLPNHDFFDEPIDMKDGIYSNYEDVYFVGDVACRGVDHDLFFKFNYQEAKDQAVALADCLVDGGTVSFQRKVIGDKDRKEIVDRIVGSKIADSV